jgi:hypothetical protein
VLTGCCCCCSVCVCVCVCVCACVRACVRVRVRVCRLGHLLTSVLQAPSVLALTATAAPRTRNSVLQLLKIPQDQQVVASPLRDNLRLRVVHVAAGAGRTGVPKHIVQLLKTGAHGQLMLHNLRGVLWDDSCSCCA